MKHIFDIPPVFVYQSRVVVLMSQINFLSKIDISKACHVSVIYENIVVVLMN